MKRIALILAVCMFVAAPATAHLADASFLQGVLDDITVAPNAGVSSTNAATDMIPDSADSIWSITASGGSVATMIIELAGFADDNIFGVYQGGLYVPLFLGANVAGDQAVLSIKADGSVYVNLMDTDVDFVGRWFGYYLDSTANEGGGVWHSDTADNVDGDDHMMAYQGKNIDTVQLPGLAPGLWTDNEYIIAFEDLHSDVSDHEHTDFVVMVESVQIPVPGAVLLGMLGLSAAGVKLRRRFA